MGVIGLQCVYALELTISKDKSQILNKLVNTETTLSKLPIPIPPASGDLVILRIHHYCCKICSSSFSQLNYLKDQEKAKVEKSGVFSDK